MSDPGQFSLVAGQTVGDERFVLREILGEGGMGVVWLAEDRHLSELVALKFLPEEWRNRQAELETLRREASKGHRLSHPCIVRIHDLFLATGEIPFISMEHVSGNSLGALKSQQPEGRFGWEEFKPFLRQLVAALEYAHRQKVLHRDLKPANIMIADDGCLKLADFGLAATLHEAGHLQTSDLGISGTLPYMSPQQLDGMHPSQADDVYSLGATIYDLLTGKPPFHTGDLKHQVRNLEPVPIIERLRQRELTCDIPSSAAAAIMACLNKDPDGRPGSAGELLDKLGVERLSGFGSDDVSARAKPGSSLLNRLRGTAEIARQQVLVKKLEIVDLREALRTIGEKVVAAPSPPERFATRVKSFQVIEAEIGDFRSDHADSADAGIASIAKNVGRAAKIHAEIETRQLRRRQLLVEIGIMALAEPAGIPDLSEALEKARAIEQKIAAALAEITRIGSTANPFTQQPLTAVITCAAVALLLYFIWPVQDPQIAHRPEPHAPVEPVQIQIEESIEAVRLRWEHERSKRREADRKKQEVKEAETRRKLAAERLLSRQEEEKKNQSATRQSRAELADNLFTALRFAPDFRFSRSLQRAGITAELRGEHAGEISKLYREKCWLELINLVLNTDHAELPDAADIEDAVEALKEQGFFVLARMSIFNRSQQPLFLVTFSAKHQGYVNFDYRWEVHPDNIGYTQKWSPSDGRALIVVSDTTSIAKAMKSLQHYYQTQKSLLIQKRKLGELDDEKFRTALTTVENSVYASVQKWIQQK